MLLWQPLLLYVQTNVLFAGKAHILQKNLFAATLTFCFYCVCSQILFLLYFLIFIIVVQDIKHSPCQLFISLLKQ